MRPLALLATAACLAHAVPAAAQRAHEGLQHAAAAEAAIRATIDRFVAAYNRGDVDALMRFYTEDFAYMALGQPTGDRQVLERGFRATLARFAGHVAITPDEIHVAGDVAFERGALVMTMTPRDGGAVETRRLRYLNVRRRSASGEWQLWRVMNNVDGPSSMPARASR